MVKVAGANDERGIYPIKIVRCYTGMDLAAAKGYLDRLRAGEELEIRPCRPEDSAAFAAQMLEFRAVEQAEVRAEAPQ